MVRFYWVAPRTLVGSGSCKIRRVGVSLAGVSRELQIKAEDRCWNKTMKTVVDVGV